MNPPTMSDARAVALLMSALLMSCGCLSDPLQDLSIEFEDTTLGSHAHNNTTYHDYIARIGSIEPEDAELYWDEVTVTIVDGRGMVRDKDRRLERHTAWPLDEPRFFYVDDLGSPGELDVGERLQFNSLDGTYNGSRVRVLYMDRVVGGFNLE
jgi:hypothetical protein